MSQTDVGQTTGETRRVTTSSTLVNKAAKDLEEGFQRLVANAVALVGAGGGSLALFDTATKRLVPMVVFSPDSPQPHEPFRPEYAAIARWALNHRTPAIVEQAATDPRMQVPGTAPEGSVLCVPLLAGQEALGTLILSTPVPGAFRRTHIKLLEMLADLAATAILQGRYQEVAFQQTQSLTMLLEVARALSNSREARQIMRLATAGIRRLIPCKEAIIFSYEADTHDLLGVAGLGVQSAHLAERRISIHDPQSVTAWVAQQRRPLMHSAGSRAFVGPVTDLLLAKQELALLAIPMVAQEKLWGVITLARPDPFETHELRTVLNLGGLVAAALAQTNGAEGLASYPASE